MNSSWGVDVGGTTTVVGLIEGEGFTVESVLDTDPEEHPGDLLHRVLEVIHSRDGSPLSIGMGVAGFVDRCAGMLRGSPNLPRLNDFPLRDTLTRMCGCPVALENDCNAFAIYALHTGNIPGEGLHLMVTLGTGIGGTIISDGSIIFGEGYSGEFGHMTVSAEGAQCACGNRGCWELYASASSLISYCPSHKGGPKQLAMRAREGDDEASGAFELFGRWVGIGISNLAWCFNPSSILLAGGLAGCYDLFGPSAEVEYRRRIPFPWTVGVLPFCGEAGAWGAAIAGSRTLR